MNSTLLCGALVADETAIRRRDLWIVDGRVRAVGVDLLGHFDRLYQGDTRVEDLSGCVIVPGGIDTHVHFEEPGNTQREDFDSGTCSAAAGGITTVVEHPLSDPPTTNAERFRAKRAMAESQAHVDFGLWGGAVPGNVPEFAGMAAEGAFGFKAFMLSSEPDYPHLDDAQLLEAMREAAALGLVILVHAENEAIVAAATARLRNAGRSEGSAHAQARPAIAELEATVRATVLAHHAACRLQVVHLSTAASIDAVALAAAHGLAARSEVCPHFLTLSDADLLRAGVWAKCTPPLRTVDEVDALWDRVLAGTGDFLVSDHAPWTADEKQRGAQDIWAAPNGIAGLQLSTVLVLTEGRQRGLSWPRFVALSSTNAARWLGLYPRKGALLPGSDADLVVYEEGVSDLVKGADLMSKQKQTPYEGRKLTARVKASMLRGRWVYRDGAMCSPAAGRFLSARSSADA